MATFTLEHDGRVLEIDRERIEVSTALPQPDPSWTYTDRALHAHAYGTKREPYPTLAWKHSEPYWCADCQDEHTDSWLECPLCGEKVRPGTFVDTSPKWIDGPTSYTLDGQGVTPQEAEVFLASARAVRDTVERRRALDAARKTAERAERAMREEGLTDDQVRRVVNRMVYGHPDGPEDAAR